MTVYCIFQNAKELLIIKPNILVMRSETSCYELDTN